MRISASNASKGKCLEICTSKITFIAPCLFSHELCNMNQMAALQPQHDLGTFVKSNDLP